MEGLLKLLEGDLGVEVVRYLESMVVELSPLAVGPLGAGLELVVGLVEL